MGLTKLQVRQMIARAVSRTVRWAEVVVSGSDTKPYQTQQVGFLGKGGHSLAWYPYGYTALAPSGTLALMFAHAGESEAHTHLPGSPKERPHPLLEGEVALFHPKTGAKIHLKNDGTIDIFAGGIDGAVNIAAGDGNITIQAAQIAAIAATLHITIGDARVTGGFQLDGALSHGGSTAGFFGASPITKPTVSGDRSQHVAIANLLIALDNMGLITDTTVP